jgi:c-di-GMP-binding flagellar brake protein YcgR
MNSDTGTYSKVNYQPENMFGGAVMAGRPHYEIQLDKRRHYRFEINRRILVRLPTGQVITSKARNISEGGLNLRCSQARAYALHPSGDPIRSHNRPEVEIRMTVPVQDELKEIAANCKILYFKVISDDEISFGLQFAELQGDSQTHLQQFLDKSI